MIEALRAKHLDIAYLGPFSYVLGHDRDAGRGIRHRRDRQVRPHLLSQPDHRAQDSGIKTVNDLKGKNFAFVDPASTSGHVFPQRRPDQAGHRSRARISAACSSPARTTPTRWRSPTSKVDAATIADRILDAAIAKGLVKAEDIQVVWRSDPIPESPTCGARICPPELKAKIKTAFLNIRDITWSDQGKLNASIETNDQAYDVIREPPRSLNLDLQKMKWMIKIQGLAKSYGGASALKGVDLSVAPGEFLVVLGPSGAGKSTLLRCINRLAAARPRARS